VQVALGGKPGEDAGVSAEIPDGFGLGVVEVRFDDCFFIEEGVVGVVGVVVVVAPFGAGGFPGEFLNG